MKKRLSYFLKVLGPGILFASTAIGVSHLVQSTRAGADFGFSLIVFVLMANIFKYPFFEFGTRYAAATRESLIMGYFKKGKWVLIIYFLITICSMFAVVAAVSFVCSGIISYIFDNQYFRNFNLVIIFLFSFCIILLITGRYKVLENFVKVISLILLLSTLIAFILAIKNGPLVSDFDFLPNNILDDKTNILFIIALMGWMPTAVDLSTWNSIWTVERIKSDNGKLNLNEILLDFNIGYIITIILSIFFISLGAYLVYGSGSSLPNSSSDFAQELIRLYTSTLGDWSYWIISICALSVMLSTTIAVFDGYARSLTETSELIFNIKRSNLIYSVTLILLAFGSYIIISSFSSNFKELIDLATTISFLIAPFCAILNLHVITSSAVPSNLHPPKWLIILSYIGIVYLITFSFIFIFYRF